MNVVVRNRMTAWSLSSTCTTVGIFITVAVDESIVDRGPRCWRATDGLPPVEGRFGMVRGKVVGP